MDILAMISYNILNFWCCTVHAQNANTSPMLKLYAQIFICYFPFHCIHHMRYLAP